MQCERESSFLVLLKNEIVVKLTLESSLFISKVNKGLYSVEANLTESGRHPVIRNREFLK